MFGHSAGAQFVHRFVMFAPGPNLRTAISANAGWYTTLEENVAFPYGLKDAPVDVDVQELAARERQDETQDDARAAAQAQQSASAAEAAQEARRTQTAQVAERADADSTRAQADAQLRRAYANPEGAGAR